MAAAYLLQAVFKNGRIMPKTIAAALAALLALALLALATLAASESFERAFVSSGFRLAELFNLDVRRIARVRDAASIEKVRADIARFVWPAGPSTDPLTKQPDTHFTAIQTVRWSRQWRLTMRHGVVSRMFFLKSSGNAGCLFLYHEGHESKAITEVPAVREIATALTGRGCDVLLLSMPLHGINLQETITVDGAPRPIKATQFHNDFYDLEGEGFSPFSYFADPVIRALDEALSERRYDRIALSGLSGGGWTTVFVGAIEPRLTHLYPVAGSMPFEVDIDPAVTGVLFSSLRGDYEQSHQEFYRNVAGYFDLYVLGVAFPNRRAIHFYNASDNCCFPGIASYAFSVQTTNLAREVTGNELRFVVDRTATKHEVSPQTLRQIAADFAP